MTDERAALYLAGALTPEERDVVEAALTTDPELAAELARLDPVVAGLAGPPVVPEPALRRRVLRRVDADLVPEGVKVSLAEAAEWRPTRIPGVTIRVLTRDPVLFRQTVMLRMEAGRAFPGHDHSGLEEVLVLEGDLRQGHLVMGPGDYQRSEGGSHHSDQTTEGGCVVLVTMPLDHVFD